MGVLSPDILLKSKYDYEIFIPAVNKLVRITAISEPQQRMKKGLFNTTKEYCVNAIQSFQQDGQMVTPNTWQPENLYSQINTALSKDLFFNTAKAATKYLVEPLRQHGTG